MRSEEAEVKKEEEENPLKDKPIGLTPSACWSVLRVVVCFKSCAIAATAAVVAAAL